MIYKCKHCESEDLRYGGSSTTLVGYMRNPNSKCKYDHNDNCRVEGYVCNQCEKYTAYSKINTCSCGWKGKTECFCSIKYEVPIP